MHGDRVSRLAPLKALTTDATHGDREYSACKMRVIDENVISAD